MLLIAIWLYLVFVLIVVCVVYLPSPSLTCFSWIRTCVITRPIYRFLLVLHQCHHTPQWRGTSVDDYIVLQQNMFHPSSPSAHQMCSTHWNNTGKRKSTSQKSSRSFCIYDLELGDEDNLFTCKFWISC